MIRRPPRSTLFPTRRSSDLSSSAIPLRHARIDPGAHLRAVLHDEGRSRQDRKSTRLNSSHLGISYAVFCLKKKKRKKKTKYSSKQRKIHKRLHTRLMQTVKS